MHEPNLINLEDQNHWRFSLLIFVTNLFFLMVWFFLVITDHLDTDPPLFSLRAYLSLPILLHLANLLLVMVDLFLSLPIKPLRWAKPKLLLTLAAVAISMLAMLYLTVVLPSESTLYSVPPGATEDSSPGPST